MKIKLDHYSKEKRQVIDPTFMGTGHAGEEKDREKVPRSYWYRSGTKPELMLKNFVKHTWEGDLDLYDVSCDPDGILGDFPDPNIWEANIITAGYDGYYNSGFYTEIISVFKKIEV